MSPTELEVPLANEYPVMIWAAGILIAPGLVDTVSTNMRLMMNSLGIPVLSILYYRMRCTSIPGESSHLFIAVDERQRVIRVPPSRLSFITGTINVSKLKDYTASITADPLGALLLKAGGGTGERISRFPPIFGFRSRFGEKQIYDRRLELEALRQDGYFALTFLPIPGVDHRQQLTTEIASLWGYSLSAHDKRWPDLLVLRNDRPSRDDLGGVPDEVWLQHALARVLEDHLPVVELDGLWMGSLQRHKASSRGHILESRSRVFYAILDWIRMRQLPYITARTFHCYVRRDLSVVVTLGSLRDRMELVAWLEAYPFETLTITHVKGETAATVAVFGSRAAADSVSGRSIAVRDSGTDNWLVIGSGGENSLSRKELEESLRSYYGSSEACNAPGSPVTSEEIKNLKFEDLIKIVRIAECEAAASGICLLGGVSTSGSRRQDGSASWSTSHRALRAAVRSHTLRTHDTLGVYRMGPYASPFFAFEVHQYISMPPDSRYQPVVSQIRLAPDEGEGEDELLKALVGTVWLLTIQEAETATNPASEFDVVQVASDRDGEAVRRLLFAAWRHGYMIGTWCRALLFHRQSLSVLVAGGTVDPLLARAGDSVVDGNRFLDVVEKALKDCTAM